MAQVKIAIAGRDYAVHCADGEEDHLAALGTLIDDALRGGADANALSETRALLYAALFLADEVSELRARAAAADIAPDAPGQPDGAPGDADDRSARALENLADRMEAFASRLEKPAANA